MYDIRFSGQFDKDFPKLEKKIQIGCLKKIRILSTNPHYGKSLVGKLKGLWELKLGKYRIIYKIFEREKLVRMVTIDLRGRVFERLERMNVD
jgi:addiction module RelE/StbE family toxin